MVGPMEECRVFLSAVSSEFGAAQNALADDFARRRMMVRVQQHFRRDRQPGTTLAALDAYIATCTAVICLIGKRSGAWPTPEEAAAFSGVLPDDVSQASYAQWAYYLARKHEKQCLLYIATDDYQPDKPAPAGPNDPELQQAFVGRIRSAGVHYDSFASDHVLCRRVALHPWPPCVAPKPDNLRHASIGSLFKGRDDAMQGLRERFTRPGGNVATITACGAVHAMGGIGKTRLAIEYARRYAYDRTALLFVEAETRDQLHTQLAALAGVLGLPAGEARDDETRLAAVLQWLQANPGWLLIVDNVDTPEALAAVTALMPRLTQGHLLLTSRLSELSAALAPLELDVLQPQDAAAFLLERNAGKRLATPQDAKQAAALAAELGQIPLALELAAACIAASKRAMSLAAYRKRLRHGFNAARAWSDPAVTQYPRAIAAAWQTSVARIGPLAPILLRQLAFLAPEPIPAFLFGVPIARGFSPQAQKQALQKLVTFSLVHTVPHNGGFVMHRLVMDVTRRRSAAKRSRLWWLLFGMLPRGPRQRLRLGPLSDSLLWINAAFTGDPADGRNWPRLDPLAPHAEMLAAWADAGGVARPTARLMGALASLFKTKGLYGRAEPLYRRALEIDEANLGTDHPTFAIHLNNLALLLQATNRFGEAEPLVRRALAITEASHGKDHPDVAPILNNLALLLQATNRFGEAESVLRRALDIDEANLGGRHPRFATELNNLAGLLQATRRFGEAEPLQRRALAIAEASLDKNHPTVATCLNNLAVLLQNTNRSGEGEPLLRRALAIDEATLGTDHPTVATNLSNLGSLLQAAGRLDEAEQLMRRALAIGEATLGPDHPDVAIRLNNLGSLLQATGRLDEAEPLMRRGLAIELAFQRDTGRAYPHCEAGMGNYATLLRAQGKGGADVALALEYLRCEAGLPPE
ncbi:MAG TPA: tetratricopeptide repeat protein [Acetobacteraceae bacterium]|nr:tetratricopeptide repeat protein [Acetobacteraceae bacterium]